MAQEGAWQPQVMQISGLKGDGLAEFWAAVTEFDRLGKANGGFAARRQQQAMRWMWERIDAGLKTAFRAHPDVQASLPAVQQAVQAGQCAPSVAARQLLAAFGHAGGVE